MNSTLENLFNRWTLFFYGTVREDNWAATLYLLFYSDRPVQFHVLLSAPLRLCAASCHWKCAVVLIIFNLLICLTAPGFVTNLIMHPFLCG